MIEYLKATVRGLTWRRRNTLHRAAFREQLQDFALACGKLDIFVGLHCQFR